MAKKEISTVKQPPELLMSREESESRIQERINIGNEYYQKQINTEIEYNQLTDDIERWNKYNIELLVRMFTNDLIAQEYTRSFGGSFLMNQTWRYWATEKKKKIADKVNRLRAILERLELIPLSLEQSATTSTQTSVTKIDNKKVFIVHGHDTEVKETVARFLEKIDLTPIILHEQANEGVQS